MEDKGEGEMTKKVNREGDEEGKERKNENTFITFIVIYNRKTDV